MFEVLSYFSNGVAIVALVLAMGSFVVSLVLLYKIITAPINFRSK
jgi:hypothetical protein